ncbi:MAG: Ig-like domain-containing protein [bacterium]
MKRFNSIRCAAVWVPIFVMVLFAGTVFAQTKKIMPVGNSITRGVTGSTDNAGYRNNLDGLLNAESVTFDFVGSLNDGSGFDADHEGHDGQTANFIRDNINSYLAAQNPDIVLLHIGTNDISGGDTPDNIRSEISAILDAINSFNSNIEIVLASLVPRTDAKDDNTTTLNTKLLGLYNEKRDLGYRIYYAGMNEVFKCNPNWSTAYMADPVHPNDAGYALMAEVWLAFIMNAINNTDITVTDNFERSNLTDLWNSDPENVISSGALINTSAVAEWNFLSVFQGLVNPNKVSMRWSTTSDNNGVELSGLALKLDGCDPATANGYAVTVRRSQREIRLWTIVSGVLSAVVDKPSYSPLSDPVPGDLLRVEMSTDGGGHRFEVFINGQSYGTLVDPAFLQGNASTLHAGIIFFGNQNNNIEDFTAEGGGDFVAPSQVTDLALSNITGTFMTVSWTAPGGDGASGQASSYDLRYATTDIQSESDFLAATPVPNMPAPAPVGIGESIIVLCLQPSTTYYFALRAEDASGNKSLISNVPFASTLSGELTHDNFDRVNLGADWSAAASIGLENNELTNTSTDPGNWDLAVFKSKFNPIEVSFMWGANADASGIDQGGIALMLDAPNTSANGYLITRRTAKNELRLWEIIGGGNPANPKIFTPTQGQLQAGDEFRIAISSDETGNHFTLFVNGVEDITITDPAPAFIDPNTIGALYSGVMLAGNHNNNIDDFKLLLSPVSLSLVDGNNQTGTVGKALPLPLKVKLTDGSNSPIANANVLFSVTGGSGSLSDPGGLVVVEAEVANVSGGMVAASDGNASQGKFIHVPDGQGNGAGLGIIPFEISVTGTYYMWGRAIYPNAQSDAFKIKIDGGMEYVWDIGQRNHQSAWEWDAVAHRGNGSPTNPEIDPVIFTFAAGSHTLEVLEGKDGAKLDQILFTTNPDFVPSGIVSFGSQLTVQTDANGEAAANWILGTTAGVNNNTATATVLGANSVDFVASSIADVPATISKLAGDNQQAQPGTQLPFDLLVQLKDQFGNLISNFQTTWSVITGNGTLATPSPVLTDVNGQASNSLTTSTDTSLTEVQVTAPGLSGAPAVFKATATAGPAEELRFAQDSGNNQSGSAGTVLAKPFKVKVLDQVGVPVANHQVTFSVTAGGGNFSGNSQTTVSTDAQGFASATLTLGGTPGDVNTARASSFFSGTAVHLNGSPLTFSATSAAPQTLQNVSSLTQSGTVEQPLANPIQVRVKDAQGQVVGNFDVTFSVTQGGGKVNGSSNPVTVKTNASGVAEVEWTLGATVGQSNNQIQASASFNGQALSGSPISFTASAVLPSLVSVSGNNQTGIVSQPLSQPFKVKVQDNTGSPISNFDVTFTVTSGNGKLDGSFTTRTVPTDGSGVAQAILTLGSTPGTNNNTVDVTAQFNGQSLNGSPIVFTASAEEGPADSISKVSGDQQSSLINTTLPQPFVVKVTDVVGNAVPGWIVTFNVTDGGGNIEGGQSKQVPTDANGVASVFLTLGSTAGTPSNPFNNKVEAVSANLNGSPVTFEASAITTGASILELIAGSGQSGQAGEALPQQIQVKVTDDQNNSIVSHPVIFKVKTGGGSFNGTTDSEITVPTNESGISAVTWYLGGSLGNNAQSIEVSSTDGVKDLSGSPLTISANASTGPVDRDVSFLSVDLGQVPADGQSVATITVTLTDKFENPVQGKAVTLNASGSNNFIVQPQNTTDANGRATGTIASTKAESKTISARNLSDGFNLNTSVNVAFTALDANKIQLSSGNSQSANVGTALENPIEVLVTDINNNPVSGVSVNFDVSGNSGFIVNGSANSQSSMSKSSVASITDAEGKARATWVLSTTPGSNTALATASFGGSSLSGSPVTFTATGQVATAENISEYSGNNQSGPAGMPLPQPFEVLVTDSNGKPVAGETVNFSAPVGGGTLSNLNPVSDYKGVAQSRLTLGTVVGENRVIASHSKGQVTFVSEGLTGAPANLLANSPNEGVGGVNTAFTVSIKITDAHGNVFEGAHAAFQIIEGAATIQSQDNSTDGFGIANAQLLLPTSIGQVVVKATSNDLPGFFELFSIEVQSANASIISVYDGDNQDGTIGRQLVYPLQIRITDAFGNPVSGQQVTWVTQSGNSVNPLESQSDENGVAATVLTIVNQGANQAAAISFGLSGSPINFNANGVTNKFPLFQNLENKSVSEGQSLSFQVLATDDDSDPITYEAQNLPPGASFNDDTFSWAPSSSHVGEHEVTFIARDNKGGLDAEKVTISVSSTNTAPTINAFSPPNLDFDTIQGSTINFSVTASDAENDQLTFSWYIATDPNSQGTLVSTNSIYQFITDNFESGTYVIKVDVSDGRDSTVMSWQVNLIITSVELVSFQAQFSGFDGVKISWVTGQEINNLGFNILRSQSRNGIFVLINKKLIASDSGGEYEYLDENVETSISYFYMLEDVDINGRKTQHGPITIDISAPETFELSQNYPNPFNPETKIRFQLPKAERVVVRVIDVLGREVRTLLDERKNPGFHELTWDAKDDRGAKVSSGIYYYQILAGEFRQTKKMLLLK